MGFVNQKSSSCKGNDHKKRRIFNNRKKGIEKKFHELRTLCGVRALLYVKSEFNRDMNGGSDEGVTTLPENPNEFRHILKDYINYNPKTGKRKRGSDEGVHSSECTNGHNKMRKLGELSAENQKAKFIDQMSTKLCDGYVKKENQDVKFNDQKLISSTNLCDLSIEEIEKIERKLGPMFARISERINQLKEKNKSTDPLEMGNNKDDMVMMNEFPSLPLEPEFQYQFSSSTEEFCDYNFVLENEFDYGINQEAWLNLPGLTNTTADDDIVFEPFPDVINFEFEPLSYSTGSLIY